MRQISLKKLASLQYAVYDKLKLAEQTIVICFSVPIERSLFLTVLHRLCGGGSDRSCVLVWKKDYHIPGTEHVALHHV